MSRCIVVCGGDFAPGLLPKKRPEDLWIAADSGLRHLQRCGLQTDLCIGDWDSLGQIPEQGESITLPVRKNDTDLVAAARCGLAHGYRRFLFFGALGGRRFSHSVAALQALHWLLQEGAEAEILDENCHIYALGPGRTLRFPGEQTGIVSVFSLTEGAELCLQGLWYSEDRLTIRSAFPLGVSNAFTGQESSITCYSGCIAVITEAPDSSHENA